MLIICQMDMQNVVYLYNGILLNIFEYFIQKGMKF